MMFAMFKDVQEKAYEEVEKVFSEADQEISLGDVNKLQYIEMILKETMRLFPAASVVGRQTTGTVQLGKIY